MLRHSNLAYTIPDPAQLDLKKKNKKRNICFTAPPRPSIPSRPLPSTSCTFGSMLTRYLKAVNQSEHFPSWAQAMRVGSELRTQVQCEG